MSQAGSTLIPLSSFFRKSILTQKIVTSRVDPDTSFELVVFHFNNFRKVTSRVDPDTSFEQGNTLINDKRIKVTSRVDPDTSFEQIDKYHEEIIKSQAGSTLIPLSSEDRDGKIKELIVTSRVDPDTSFEWSHFNLLIP